MPISEAKKQSNKRWNDKNKSELYDQIAILCPKGERATVKTAAKKAGVSLSVYIMEAVRRRMEIERDATEPPQDANAQAAESP